MVMSLACRQSSCEGSSLDRGKVGRRARDCVGFWRFANGAVKRYSSATRLCGASGTSGPPTGVPASACCAEVSAPPHRAGQIPRARRAAWHAGH
eukprot:7350956-Prymnesium_polylepis.1